MSSASFPKFNPPKDIEDVKKQYDAMRKYVIDYHLNKASAANAGEILKRLKKATDEEIVIMMEQVGREIERNERHKAHIKDDETRKQQREQMKKHLTEYYSDSDSPEHNELLASLDRMSFDDLVDLNRVVEQEENTETLLNSFGGKRTLRRKQKVVRKSKKRSGHKRSEKKSRRRR
jgi:hypothetical protein